MDSLSIGEPQAVRFAEDLKIRKIFPSSHMGGAFGASWDSSFPKRRTEMVQIPDGNPPESSIVAFGA